MNSIILLTRLQLKQMLGGLRAALEKRTGANGVVAGTAIIGIIVIVGLAWLGHSAYGLVGSMGIDKTIYDILFIAVGGFTFVFALPQVLSSFFGSSDVADLLPLPVSPTAVAFSKALSSLSSGYLWTVLFIGGPLLGWGIAAGAGVHYWITYVLALLLTPLTPTAYAGTLGILIAAIFKRVRRKDTITMLTTVIALLFSVVVFFVVNATSSSDVGALGMLRDMSGAMGGVVMAFPAYGFAVFALQQLDPLGMAMFALLSIATFAVFVLVARLLYLRIVTSLSSGGATAAAYIGQGAQSSMPVAQALFRTEVRKVVRNSSILLNYVVYPLVITPVLIGFMVVSGNWNSLLDALGASEDPTRLVGGFALTFLMFLSALSVATNKIAGTAISRDGTNWMHVKFLPVPYITQVRAKIMPSFAVSALISVIFVGVGGALVATRAEISLVIVVCGLALMLGASWLMTCIAIWCDSCNPRVEWGNDADVNVKAVRGTGGEIRAMIVGFVYAALPLLVSPLVGLDPIVFMPIVAVVGVVAAVVLGRLLLTATCRNIAAFE